jgi:UDP-N-acetylglucosamine--N-acetylmuramyl-(pentapeptide) pyrophosphoryl-undecaprenol N-acetylglucosamine transferase
LLAAGGTGGHIYPAVALAEALTALAPEVKIQFCCGNRPDEWQIYRRLGLQPWILPVTYHRRGLAARGRFVRQMLAAWSESRRLLRQNPVQVAVGFGSYVSVPPLLGARLAGARLVLHEQNLYAGLANRVMAPWARAIATAGPLARPAFPAARTHEVGNPIRAEILRPVSREEARAFFRLKPDRLVCLCLGGSQGARGINRLVLDFLQRVLDTDTPATRWQFLWSTGTANFEWVSQTLQQMGVDPSEHGINPYLHEMALAYAAADLVLTRAGALSIAELTALGLPAILVPLPSAAGGHQAINARRLVQAGAAEVLEEADPRAAETLDKLLSHWARNPQALAPMGQASRALGRPDAARDLARLVLDVVFKRI